jgi:predicted Zn-dependent peptidase
MRKLVALMIFAAACGPKNPPTAQPAPPPDPPVVDTTPIPTPDPEPPRMTQTATPQELVFPDEAFRKEQPKPAAARPFRLPTMKPFSLKNGIKVYLVEQHALPLVAMDLVFDGGNATDPVGKEGLASVCMAMLTEGTEKLDKIQYSEALADTASNIGSFGGEVEASVSLSTLTKHLPSTFALYVDTLRTPGFRQRDFDLMIKRRIEAVKQSKGTPAGVFSRVLPSVLYGEKHPFGRVTSEASLAAIALDECKAYAKKQLLPGAARLFVVGDLDEAGVRALFEGEGATALAGWKGKAPAPKLPAPKTASGRIFFVNMKGVAQSQVSLLHFGPKRNATDYFANTMMAGVFGGGFASRINMNLREDKGYSYGARGAFSYSKQYGVFSAGSSVRTDSTFQSLIEINHELVALQSGKSPVTKDELTREKDGAILGLPGRFATAGSSLGQYRSLVYFGLPLDYYNSYVANVEKVSEKAVTASAKKHLKLGDAVYLVVGDGDAMMKSWDPATRTNVDYLIDGKPATLRQALTDLAAKGTVGKGAFVELDVDGKVLK